MGQKIYCLDVDEQITPLKVRDATIECFIQAHAEILEAMKEYHEFSSEIEFEKMKRLDVKLMVQSKFSELKADFNNPTKKDLLAVIDRLADYSANFRKPEIIKKHYDEIKLLIDKLK